MGIYKAKATFWLKTEGTNKNDEADSYFDKAEQLDPGNPRIGEAKEELKKSQARLLCKLGMDAFENANKIYNVLLISKGKTRTRDETAKLFVNAAIYLLQANFYDSDNLDALSTISTLVNKYKWIPWSNEMKKKAQFYDDYEKKQQELEKKKQVLEQNQQKIESLPKYIDALEKAEKNLSIAKQEKGFFAGRKVKEAEERVNQLKDYIVYLEKLISLND